MLKRPKPLIRFVGGRWICVERGLFALSITGCGATPSAALRDMKARQNEALALFCGRAPCR
ncbi:hypothetical protein C8E08_4571 [Paracidovorax citrulli]|nr:hypothetical protein C8E08_4571 [Paracidovorax citrulli]REG68701.1 hypothetical protein C8E07_1820 [Paracidovorax citrulli]RLJ93256.1 hypothetical protein C8E06_1820 [Paracidovorax citrulli]